MFSLRNPSAVNQKPPMGAAVDLNHIFAPRLRYALPFSNQGTSGGECLNSFGLPVNLLGYNATAVVPQPDGFRADGSTSAIVADLGDDNNFAGEMTVLCRAWRASESTSLLRCFFGDNASGGAEKQLSCYFEQVGGTGDRITLWSAGVKVATSNFTPTVTTWLQLAIVRSGASGNWTYKIYKDGILDVAAVTATNPTITTDNMRVGFAGLFTGAGWNGVYDYFFMWQRALSDYEILTLTQNPWQLWQPPGLKVWWAYGVSAGGGTAYVIGGGGGAVCGSGSGAACAYTPGPSGGGVDGSQASTVWAATFSASGGDVDGSQGTAASTYTPGPSGGAVDGSSSTTASAYTPTQSGGGVDGSQATTAWAATISGSGGDVGGSQGTATWAATASPSGGAVDGSGTSTATTAAGSGGGVGGSQSTTSWTSLFSGSGGNVDGSGSTASTTFTPSPSGGVADGSGVSTTVAYVVSGSGGNIDGSQADIQLSGLTEISGQGGSVAGSQGGVSWGALFSASGGEAEGSQSDTVFVYTPVPSGGAVGGSESGATATYAWAASGGAVDGSAATIVQAGHAVFFVLAAQDVYNPGAVEADVY